MPRLGAAYEIMAVTKAVGLHTLDRKRQQELVECRVKPGDVGRGRRVSDPFCYGCPRRQIVVPAWGSSSKKLTAKVEGKYFIK